MPRKNILVVAIFIRYIYLIPARVVQYYNIVGEVLTPCRVMVCRLGAVQTLDQQT